MASQDSATRLERLRVLRDAWMTAWEASVTAQALSIKPSYSIEGQSVSWGEVNSSAPKIIEELDNLIARLSWHKGPVFEYKVP